MSRMAEGSSSGQRNGLPEHQVTASEMAFKTAGDSSLLVTGTPSFMVTKIGSCDFQREFRTSDRLPGSYL
jgi:hypothetical protein